MGGLPRWVEDAYALLAADNEDDDFALFKLDMLNDAGEGAREHESSPVMKLLDLVRCVGPRGCRCDTLANFQGTMQRGCCPCNPWYLHVHLRELVGTGVGLFRRTTNVAVGAPHRYDDPFLTAKAFQLMERLTSKREKLVSELMRTYVVTDEDLIALSQWAAMQVRGSRAVFPYGPQRCLLVLGLLWCYVLSGLQDYLKASLMTPRPLPFAQVEAAHLAFNYMGSLVPAESAAACTKAAAALDALTSLLVPLQQIAITLPDGTPDRVFISKATAANCQFMLYDMQVGNWKCCSLRPVLPRVSCLPRTCLRPGTSLTGHHAHTHS